MTTPDKTKTVAQILKRNALIEAEQKRVKTLPRGWNAVKDYVFTGKVNKWVRCDARRLPVPLSLLTI